MFLTEQTPWGQNISPAFFDSHAMTLHCVQVAEASQRDGYTDPENPANAATAGSARCGKVVLQW